MMGSALDGDRSGQLWRSARLGCKHRLARIFPSFARTGPFVPGEALNRVCWPPMGRMTQRHPSAIGSRKGWQEASGSIVGRRSAYYSPLTYRRPATRSAMERTLGVVCDTNAVDMSAPVKSAPRFSATPPYSEDVNLGTWIALRLSSQRLCRRTARQQDLSSRVTHLYGNGPTARQTSNDLLTQFRRRTDPRRARGDLEEKEALLAPSQGFFTIPHSDGYAAILIQLKVVTKRLLKDAILDGWLACAPAQTVHSYMER